MEYFDALVENTTDVYAESPEDAIKELEARGYVVIEIYNEEGETFYP